MINASEITKPDEVEILDAIRPDWREAPGHLVIKDLIAHIWALVDVGNGLLVHAVDRVDNLPDGGYQVSCKRGVDNDEIMKAISILSLNQAEIEKVRI